MKSEDVSLEKKLKIDEYADKNPKNVIKLPVIKKFFTITIWSIFCSEFFVT